MPDPVKPGNQVELAATAPAKPPPPELRGYFQLTRSGTYSFLAVMPLFVLYELLITLVNLDRELEIRISADIWLKQMLAGIGLSDHAAVAGVVGLVGLIVFLSERRYKIAIHRHYFVYMLIESLFYAIFTAWLVSDFIRHIFGLHTLPVLGLQSVGLLTQVTLSLGAGLYEELFFRVILVSGLFWGFSFFADNKPLTYVMAAFVGAAIFSGIHHLGEFGDPFSLSVFTFRLAFGLCLNALYLARGFGIAAWTHALYDIMVVLLSD